MISLADYSARDGLGLAELVARKEVTSGELVEAAFAAIEKVNPRLNAVLQTLPDLAHAEIRTGLPHGPFAGFRFSSRSSSSMPKTSAATRVAGLPEASSPAQTRS